MPVWRRLSRIALTCLILCPLAVAAAPSDRAAAERILGRQWKSLSRHAGMIFAGTVLGAGPPLAQTVTQTGAPSQIRLEGNFRELRFHIDRPIAGVKLGRTLTIREWVGALSRQPALHPGERVLLLLYPPSRLGLTSPVGGAQGQIRLDSTGQNVLECAPPLNTKSGGAYEQSQSQNARSGGHPISLSQLERAIRAARGE
jgi:hypothetical protein